MAIIYYKSLNSKSGNRTPEYLKKTARTNAPLT